MWLNSSLLGAKAAGTALEITNSVAVSGSRAIDKAQSYEGGVRGMQGNMGQTTFCVFRVQRSCSLKIWFIFWKNRVDHGLAFLAFGRVALLSMICFL